MRIPRAVAGLVSVVSIAGIPMASVLAAPSAATVVLDQLEDGPLGVVRFEAQRVGWLSVDRGPWQGLPLEVPADGRTRRVVVDLGIGEPAGFELPFLTQRVRFRLQAAQGPRVRLESAVVAEAELLVDGKSIYRGPVEPGHAVFATASPSARRVSLFCRAPGRTLWSEEIVLIGPRDLELRCDPPPVEGLLFLRSDAPQTRFSVELTPVPDLRLCPPELDCSRDVPDFGPSNPVRVVDFAESGRWYVTRALGLQRARICALAPGRESVCRFSDPASSVGPVRLSFALPPHSEHIRPDPKTGTGGVQTVVGGPWPPGTVDVDAAIGVTHKHRRTFGAAGAALRVTPAWAAPCLRNVSTGCLGFEFGMLAEQAEEPVYLERWESETRLTRFHLAATYAPWRFRPAGVELDPFVNLGGFASPDVAVGPWAGAGLRVRNGILSAGPLFGLPIFLPRRLGSVGYEALLTVAVALPGGEP